MDPRLNQRLASQLGSGRMILFTGAGFSLEAKNRQGLPLPGVGAITEALWTIAFGDTEMDGSQLDDVFDAALMQRRNDTIDFLRSRLTVDPGTLPAEYQTWYSFPWYRIYTLNIDDVGDAAARAFDLPRRLQTVSALEDALPGDTDDLLVIHLNGRLSDLPNVTFSRRQYAERQSTWDLWYANLIRELAHHPVLYVGTSLNEPPLWQYIEARGRKSGERELRPGSYLVSPTLPLAKRTALRHYNIDWVDLTGTQFVDQVLTALDSSAQTGLLELRRQRRLTSGDDAEPILDVSAVANDSVNDEREFLLGREPRWSDISRGYAIEREFDRVLAAQINADRCRLVFVTGTAGAGKSTSAMRLALSYVAEGKRTFLLNPDALKPIPAIRTAVTVSAAEVLLIDDADRFGHATAGLLHDLISDNPSLLVIASMRSVRYGSLGLSEEFENSPGVLHTATPLLGDEDIDALLSALNSANRLGVLKGKSREIQHQVFAKVCGRQLLVAMIEATSGVRFDAKVQSECEQVEGTARLVYALAALATGFRMSLTAQEVLSACGGDAPAVMQQLNALEREHLLVRSGERLTLRHRVIAERAVRYFRETRQLATPIRGLAFSLAASAPPGPLRHNRPGRLLIRLLNHDWLLQVLASGADEDVDLAQIREVYETVEPLLANDYHYWLQRGSLETEKGRIDLAKNFLDQALALGPEDPFVRTEWAYMTLKRASRNAQDPGAFEQAQVAFEELQDVIQRQRGADPHPFHVYGSQGLAWAKRAPIGTTERIQLLSELRAIVNDGVKKHAGRADLITLARDLEREYLMIAVPAPEATVSNS
jgi:hypothetical protein